MPPYSCLSFISFLSAGYWPQVLMHDTGALYYIVSPGGGWESLETGVFLTWFRKFPWNSEMSAALCHGQKIGFVPDFFELRLLKAFCFLFSHVCRALWSGVLYWSPVCGWAHHWHLLPALWPLVNHHLLTIIYYPKELFWPGLTVETIYGKIMH